MCHVFCVGILYGLNLFFRAVAVAVLTGPLTLTVNIGPLLENFSKLEFRSSEKRAGSRRLPYASSLKGNSVTGHVFTLELNYLLWRRLLHLLSVKLLNTGNEKHSIILCRVFLILFQYSRDLRST